MKDNTMKTTIKKLKKLIREAFGQCPKCGGPGGIDGFTSVYPCSKCTQGHGNNNMTNDNSAFELCTIAARHGMSYDDCAWISKDGTTFSGIIDSDNGECIIYWDPVAQKLFQPGIDTDGVLVNDPDKIIDEWKTMPHMRDDDDDSSEQ